MSGKLTIVPTPIGNLKDITYRAVEVLSECDLIYAEDTRTTGKLLKHYNILTNCTSFHIHNEHGRLEQMVEKIKEGKNICLVSDAGTPAISDPGFIAVRACKDEGLTVECLPGATAFVPALVSTGFPINQFIFMGFLPTKKGRKTMLDSLEKYTQTLVFYESPHRIGKTLNQLSEVLNKDRLAAVCRELTKIHEEIKTGTLEELAEHYTNNKTKGEIVLIVNGKA